MENIGMLFLPCKYFSRFLRKSFFFLQELIEFFLWDTQVVIWGGVGIVGEQFVILVPPCELPFVHPQLLRHVFEMYWLCDAYNSHIL